MGPIERAAAAVAAVLVREGVDYAQSKAVFTAVCMSLGKVLAMPEPALGIAGRDGAER
jgi:integrase/recombinase XerD